ncbi:phosphatidylserine/phosphatidylglycerophosphate/cardiolipin synthase family protein [bacterium]|nr:phosphatidylserine/phosphatidylglycerophosphate/cardiolipin synthase family protein [bacterium]
MSKIDSASRSHQPSRVPAAAKTLAAAAGPTPTLDSRLRTYPQGRSPIGTAVNQAVFETNKGTVEASRAFAMGSVEDIWINDVDAEDEAIDQVISLLDKAQLEICIQTFIFDYKSEASKRLLKAISEKQAKNPDFKVYIAYNRDLNPFGQTMEQALAKAGVKAEVAFYAGAVSRQSNHTKMFVLDGREAVIGGDNIDNPKERDMMIHVRGPVVDSFLQDFDDAWRTSKRWLNSSATPPVHLQGPPLPSTQPQVPMTMLTKRGVAWSGDYLANDADQGLLAAMKAAKTSIKLATPNLNSPEVWDAIEDAAKRGVKVQLVVAKMWNPVLIVDRATAWAAERFVAQLPPEAQKNVELRWFSEDGKKVSDSHAKYLAVDGQWAYVGSQNMDNQSWSFSREVGVGIDDPAQVRRLDEALFDADWKTSIPAKIDWWDKIIPLPARNWGERLLRLFFPIIAFFTGRKA